VRLVEPFRKLVDDDALVEDVDANTPGAQVNAVEGERAMAAGLSNLLRSRRALAATPGVGLR
jgi:hypothetical protein